MQRQANSVANRQPCWSILEVAHGSITHDDCKCWCFEWKLQMEHYAIWKQWYWNPTWQMYHYLHVVLKDTTWIIVLATDVEQLACQHANDNNTFIIKMEQVRHKVPVMVNHTCMDTNCKDKQSNTSLQGHGLTPKIAYVVLSLFLSWDSSTS